MRCRSCLAACSCARTRRDRGAVSDHRIPAGTGDPRAHPPGTGRRPRSGDRLSEVLLETLVAIHAVDTAASVWTTSGGPQGFLARAVAGWRKRGMAALEDGTEAVHVESAPGWKSICAGWRAGAAAQRLQAQQHDPGPAGPVAGGGGGLGPRHARRSVVRFRHVAELLGARGRSAGAARHGADAGGRRGFLAAPAGGRAPMPR